MDKKYRIAPQIAVTDFPHKIKRRVYVENGLSVLEGKADVSLNSGGQSNQYDDFGKVKDDDGNEILGQVPVENDIHSTFESFVGAVKEIDDNNQGGV